MGEDQRPGQLGRAAIIYRPAAAMIGQRGETMLAPRVTIADATQSAEVLPVPIEPMITELPADSVPPSSLIAPHPDSDHSYYDGWIPPIMSAPEAPHARPLGPLSALILRIGAELEGPRSPEPGVGTEFVMHAPSFIDTTEPLQSFRLRFDSGANWEFPDRAEYFWAKTPAGRGPADPLDLDRGE
jgi:hypothetical protein